MIHFGTGGWRAVIGDEFTRGNLQLLAQALCDKMKAEHVEDKDMVIGYDRRFLSKESMFWLAEVFAGNGIHTLLIERSCPTPLVMYYVQQNALPYGLMVTASHNPAVYNGVKVFTRGGRDADKEQTNDLEKYANAVKDIHVLPLKQAEEEKLAEEIEPINDYIDSILSDIDMSAIRKADLHVALDPMYGVSETSIRTILMTCRCQVDTIHGRHDPLFGGHLPAPNAKGLEELGVYVTSHRLDLGIATDGDADRIGIVDDKGNYLSPNDILVILYWYLVKYRGKHGPCVRNLCTTHRLDRLAQSFGQECYEVPVGFKWVSAKMDETDAIIGGESSGGMSVNGHIKGKDGVYAAALLVEMIAVTGKPMSQIMEEIHSIVGDAYMAEHSYRFEAELTSTFQQRIMVDKEIPRLPYDIEHVSYLDGCKIFFTNDGWVSVRFSGTEPLLRIFCEMPKKEDAEKVCEIYREALGLKEES